jgi:hypothetical protein
LVFGLFWPSTATGAYRIIPAPTVLLLLSSMMMKAPVPRFKWWPAFIENK